MYEDTFASSVAAATTGIGNTAETNDEEIAISGNATVLYAYCQNSHTATVWLNLYDAAAEDVTEGTGRVVAVPVPAGFAGTIPIDQRFHTAITALASTEADGTGSDPAVLLRVRIVCSSVVK